tara:strand:- start:416 stop:601 length:186 start_codon:yes stop_codon:yes gene_type:complete
MYFFSAVIFASHCSSGSERDHDHSEETSEAKSQCSTMDKENKEVKSESQCSSMDKASKEEE